MLMREPPAMNPALHWTLLAAPPDARVELLRWTQQALTLVRAELGLVETISDREGWLPAAASLTFTLRREGEHTEPTRVRVHTAPIEEAPAAREAADAAVRAIGGAGMDFLVARAQRVWMIEAKVPAGDPRAPLAMAALLAGVLLAPVVPPEGGAIFGLKGARSRLEALGWAT